MTQPITQQQIQQLEALRLPKWPQMLVWGTPVTEAQAKDIILRTDLFFSEVTNFPDGGNRKWIEWAQKELGFHHLVQGYNTADRRRAVEAEAVLQEELKVVRTTYVHNSWASSSFWLGPYGWCHPNGTLWYEDNVGKHPGARCLFEEWQAIASAFPFLDLTVTLMSGERLDDDTSPVVSFSVCNGRVKLLELPVLPVERLVPPRQEGRRFGSFDEELAAQQGLPNQWVSEYGDVTRKILKQFR